MIVGSNFANFLAYIYHLIFGRLLGPAVYGELASIVSLSGFFISFFSFLSVSIVKFVSSANEKGLDDFYTLIFKKIYPFVLGITVILFIGSFWISKFLGINSFAVYLVGPIIFLSFLQIIYSSYLQGLLKFKENVIVNNLGWVVRILLGLVF